MLRNTEALFINGFVFDELPAGAVLQAARVAQAAGAAVFFDPGGAPVRPVQQQQQQQQWPQQGAGRCPNGARLACRRCICVLQS